METHDAFVIVW